MPVKALRIPLEQGKYYHVYNRGNNKEKLFYSSADYYVFLKKYHDYLEPYVTTYAYCLLPNHFHFLIKIRNNGEGNDNDVSNQFRKLFICHAIRINRYNERKGCLLTRNYRRAEILDEKYLMNVVRYIHFNPVKHGYSDSISHYYHSSYQFYICNNNTHIEKTEVLLWFGGLDQFLDFHQDSESEMNLPDLQFEY